MASAYSPQPIYKEREDQFNKPLINQALSMRQGKYDFNKSKVQQVVNNLASLDIMKGEDQQYLYDRITKAVDTVNEYGMGNLSIDAASDYISNYVSQVADDKVVNAVHGTMTVRNIQSQAEEAKENGEYSDLNYAYSMQDAAAWLKDGQAGTKYTGRTDYVPYVDMNEKLMESIMNLTPASYSVINSRGQFEYYKENGEILSEERVRAAAELAIKSDAKMSSQMTVNAWGEFQGVADADLMNSYKDVVQGKIDQYDKVIKEYNRELATVEDPTEAQSLQQAIDFYTTEKSGLEKVITTQTENISREAIETLFYQEGLLDQYASTYAYKSITDTDIISNEAAISRAETASDIIAKVIDYRTKGVYEGAEELYNNYSNILKDSGYPPQYSTWSANQSIDDASTKNIDLNEMSFSDIENIKTGASQTMQSSVQYVADLFTQVYDQETLKRLGIIDSNGSVNTSVVATELKNFSNGGGLLSDKAVNRFGGVPLTDEQYQQMLGSYGAYQESVAKLDIIQNTENEVRGELLGNLMDNTQTWVDNVATYNDEHFAFMGNPATIEIEVNDPSTFKVRGNVNSVQDDFAGGTHDVNYATIYFQDGKYYYEEGVNWQKADYGEGINTAYEAFQWAAMDLAQLGGKRVPRQATFRTEISKDQVSSIVEESVLYGNSDVQTTLPSGKLFRNSPKIDGERFGNPALIQSEVNARVQQQLQATFGELYGDRPVVNSYLVSKSEPATVEAFSELVTAAVNNNVNDDFPASLRQMVDPDFYETLRQNSIKGGGENTEDSEIRFPSDARFYYDDISGMAVLEVEGEKLQVSLDQLSPNSVAFQMLDAQRQVVQTKLSYNVQSKFIFDQMTNNSMVKGYDSYGFNGQDLTPELNGWKFNIDYENIFSKGQVNGVNTINPRMVLGVTKPDGTTEKQAVNSARFGQSEYADAINWIQTTSSNYTPSKGGSPSQIAQAEANLINLLYSYGYIDNQTYQQLFDE